MPKTVKKYNYFEVCLGKGPDEDPDNDTWICIKAATLVMPSIEILTEFLKTDLRKRPGSKVIGFYAIDEATARSYYDFDNEPNWPVLGGELLEQVQD